MADENGELSRLPPRPRLPDGVAVLWRRPETAQLGLNPEHAVVVDGLSRPTAELLRNLDGSRTRTELVDSAHPDQRHDALELLHNLNDAGLLEDARAAPGGQLAADAAQWRRATGRCGATAVRQRRDTLIEVHGDGRIAVCAAELLAAAGIGWVHVHATGNVRREDIGSGYTEADIGLARSTAAARAVRRANATTRCDPTPAHRVPSLVLLADAEVPDPVVVEDLTARRVPHLIVKYRQGLVVIGPLVIHGRSSCLRCADLHRTELEPTWPTIAPQLAGHAQPADLAGANIAASFAVSQALLFTDSVSTDQSRSAHDPPACWNATLEIDVVRGELHRRPWPPHPACACGASS